jgi:Peptidase family C78
MTLHLRPLILLTPQWRVPKSNTSVNLPRHPIELQLVTSNDITINPNLPGSNMMVVVVDRPPDLANSSLGWLSFLNLGIRQLHAAVRPIMENSNPVIDLCDESDDESREPCRCATGLAIADTDERIAKRGQPDLVHLTVSSVSVDSADTDETANQPMYPAGECKRKRARMETPTHLEDKIAIKDDAPGTTDESSTTQQALMVLLTSSDPTDERFVVTSNLLDSFGKPRPIFTRRPVRLCSSSTLLHVQQRDSWSCGFRNVQMVLSALLPQLPPTHAYFADRPRESTDVMDVPSLNQLQHCLELAWARGMDPKGCQHYGGRIANTQAQIGAVEAATALNACGLDATVVQFISVQESRTQLGPFCAAYMDRQSCIGRSSREVAVSLLRGLNSTERPCIPPPQPDSPSHGSEAAGPSLPLYLQYKGHSVTIVGVEYDNHQMNPKVSNVLVFDPRQRGEHLHSALQRGDFAPFRRSVSRLHCQDTQVVLCTPSEIHTKDMSVATAHEDAVLRHRRR